MIIYLLKSATCLALLLFFYHFVLEKEKMHNFNRFYLLGSVFFSFLVPLTTFTTYVKPMVINTVPTTIEDSFFVENTNPIFIEESIDYSQLLLGVYVFICAILLFRFTRNLYKILKKIHKNEKVKQGKATLILVDDKILPHTFWNFIFINKKDYNNGKIEAELFTHELTHVTQKHTFDVLFIELLQAIFWINPLFIFLKKAIQLNHEYLADEKVINQYKNPFQYQHLLLNKAAWNNEYYLASNLNYSLTKKRLEMMTTQSSKTIIWLKKLAVMPLLAAFTFLFAERVEAQEKHEIIETVYEQPQNVQKIKDLSESEIYKKYYYKNLTIQRKDKNGKYVIKKYNELNEEEKSRLIPPPPLKLKKTTPTKAQFEALKDKTKYAVWIDGKVVDNSILNNYKYTDFARYSNSHVYKNARSKRFPQENQASLDTHKYFETQNKKRVEKFQKYLKEEYKVEEVEIIEEKPKKKKYIDSPIPTNKSSKQSIGASFTKKFIKAKENTSLEKYNYLNKLYEGDRNLKPHFVKSSKVRQDELNDLFSKLGSMYFKLPKSYKKKVKRPIPPHYPYLRLMKNNIVFYKLRDELTKEDKLLIPPPPPNPKASKEDILKAKKAYSNWEKRTGNDLSNKVKKENNTEIIYKYRFSIYLNEENRFDVFGKWVTLENLKKELSKTHKQIKKKNTKALLVVHPNAKKEISNKAQEILKKYGILITVVSKYIPWSSAKNIETPPPPPKPDWVYTYQRLAAKVKRTEDNRKANLIYLKEIYNNKMSNKEREKVTAPNKILPPPPPEKK
ncbi:M56 family metallopeptidase [Polaribacter aestuariivivens]|uniref:M56 family metallopeptidase n=1 Tax=Polaribacter aestuariivivens TaxID=2304626 RepID=A0A5S3NAP9_9FLAO|nr:M56 family metallopeptidase [Polaribacter aestuariivivens]TMM32285.1 M56 family metallopeptidase [Polaribacter aestuariivivens]